MRVRGEDTTLRRDDGQPLRRSEQNKYGGIDSAPLATCRGLTPNFTENRARAIA